MKETIGVLLAQVFPEKPLHFPLAIGAFCPYIDLHRQTTDAPQESHMFDLCFADFDTASPRTTLDAGRLRDGQLSYGYMRKAEEIDRAIDYLRMMARDGDAADEQAATACIAAISELMRRLPMAAAMGHIRSLVSDSSAIALIVADNLRTRKQTIADFDAWARDYVDDLLTTTDMVD